MNIQVEVYYLESELFICLWNRKGNIKIGRPNIENDNLLPYLSLWA